MAERYPMTIQQRQVLQQDIAELREKLAEVVSLVRVCFGENKEAFVRAEETAAALQRLEWVLEREEAMVSS
jgi:hypothetical protein